MSSSPSGPRERRRSIATTAPSPASRHRPSCSPGPAAYSEQWLNGALSYRPARLCYVTWPSPELDSPYHTEGQPIHVEIDARPWHAQKRAAFLAHSSQQQHRENFERIAMTPSECYFVASGTPAPPGATDLFAGL